MAGAGGSPYSTAVQKGVYYLQNVGELVQAAGGGVSGALDIQLANLTIQIAQMEKNILISEAQSEMLQTEQEALNTTASSNNEAMNQNVQGINQQNANMAQNASSGIGETEFRV